MGPPGDWPLQQWEPRHLGLWLLLGGRGMHGAGVGEWVGLPGTEDPGGFLEDRPVGVSFPKQAGGVESAPESLAVMPCFPGTGG